VLSPDAVSSPTCQKEVAFAASLNKRFAPIVCRPVDIAKAPSELSRLNFISFEDETRFEESVEKLALALATDIEWTRKHTEFGELARRWWEAGRATGLLLRSPALDEAEQWFIRQPQGAPMPTEMTRVFLVESRKAETAARARRRQIAALLCGLALLPIGGGIGWWNQDWLKEQYQWRMVMGPSEFTPEQERALAGIHAGVPFRKRYIVFSDGKVFGYRHLVLRPFIAFPIFLVLRRAHDETAGGDHDHSRAAVRTFAELLAVPEGGVGGGSASVAFSSGRGRRGCHRDLKSKAKGRSYRRWRWLSVHTWPENLRGRER
jgi:hypothetical protein